MNELLDDAPAADGKSREDVRNCITGHDALTSRPCSYSLALNSGISIRANGLDGDKRSGFRRVAPNARHFIRSQQAGD